MPSGTRTDDGQNSRRGIKIWSPEIPSKKENQLTTIKPTNKARKYMNVEDNYNVIITSFQGDINFIFEWQKQCLVSECSK